MGPLRLSLRSTETISAVFLVSLVFVVGLLTLLNYLKFESYANGIAERSFGIVTDRIRSSMETALRLGLQLEDIESARTLLRNTQASDASIENISIFENETGRILFSSDPGAIGSQAHPNWLAAHKRAAGGAWRIQSRAHATIGRRLDSALDNDVGAVALSYSLADMNAHEDAMLRELVVQAIVALAVFSAVGVIGAFLVTRDFRRTVTTLSDAIDASELASAAMLPDALRAAVVRFRHTASEARSQLDQLEEALPEQVAEDLTKETVEAGGTR